MTKKKMRSLNTTYYLFLNVLDKYGVKVTRSYIKKTISELCKLAGVTRESIGIFAGVRAELYFAGEWKSVSIDNVDELAAKGTDIVFIEKGGIPEAITDWADKYGIAMVNTRGHLTEYGKDLINTAKKLGANTGIMADYDASGIKIASESPTEIPWFGANDKMLEYFKLDKKSVAIESETKINKEPVRRLVQSGKHDDGGRDTRFKDVDVDFLCDKDNAKRVELDAILAKVDDERFFEYIMKQLPETRNYNRAIEVPEVVESEEHDTFRNLLDTKIQECIESERKKIIDEQKQIKGFIDVQEKIEDNKERLKKVLTNIPEYNDLVTKLNELKSHPFFKEDIDTTL